jgi:HEPN domain-containing protein
LTCCYVPKAHLTTGKRNLFLKKPFTGKGGFYMNINDVREWFRMADNDFDSAMLLNEAVRRHYEIICYHCAQSVEKYLKGYLIYHDVIPQKTHDLIVLNNHCKEMDGDFANIRFECAILIRFSNDIRYPNQYETTEDDVQLAINAVEKIRNFKPISDIRNMTDDNDDQK